ncbi:MAG: hypothetical protein Q7S58_10240 [Candidatus Binatus sp.]|uniref:hypothetical protein n=1 Tax=Candidatus Binatus sp. TaxID=2811406 RepID=UPI0027173F0B|nr:hypothetical protein [Candidatus Binatus sp.]MDO8432771.1 hypothetical protein [Candidatus Binatus sp.]
MKKIVPQNISPSSAHSSIVKRGVKEPSYFTSNLLEHWLIIRPWWRRIAIATALGVLITFVMSEFVMSHWYQATAMIRPASQQGPVSPLAMMLGNSSFSAALGNMISSSAGLSEQLPSDAGEYVDLMQSHDLTVALIKRHNLGPILDHKSLVTRLLEPFDRLLNAVVGLFVAPDPGSTDRMWHWYEQMQRRFAVDYDSMQGNLTLTFLDRDPETAKKILGYYIDDLREKLRRRTIENTSAAIESLQEALQQTPDPLVQQQVAQIIAQEIQQEKTAQAEADFAFSVTDPPYVPQHIYKPNPLLLCLIAALAVPFLALVVLELHANVYVPFREADQALDRGTANDMDGAAHDRSIDESRSRPAN